MNLNSVGIREMKYKMDFYSSFTKITDLQNLNGEEWLRHPRTIKAWGNDSKYYTFIYIGDKEAPTKSW